MFKTPLKETKPCGGMPDVLLPCGKEKESLQYVYPRRMGELRSSAPEKDPAQEPPKEVKMDDEDEETTEAKNLCLKLH